MNVVVVVRGRGVCVCGGGYIVVHRNAFHRVRARIECVSVLKTNPIVGDGHAGQTFTQPRSIHNP